MPATTGARPEDAHETAGGYISLNPLRDKDKSRVCGGNAD